MRLGILIVALGVTLLGSGFWYDYVDATCDAPIAYRIGEIDARFGTNADEIRRIALRAESLWESKLSDELFVYDEQKGIPLNLIFDERQEVADREADLRQDLEMKEGMSENVSALYQALITEFRALKKQYESRVVSYEASLKAYNEKVTEWNDAGGAPPDEVEALQEEEEVLQTEFEDIQALTNKINVIVDDLNKIGAKGNLLITNYNEVVKSYNAQFREGHEFTQGDYGREAINIYQFDSEEELVIVLAHEFGHSLALGHVGNERSIMYKLMEHQDVASGLTTEDVAEYSRVCNEKSALLGFIHTIKKMW